MANPFLVLGGVVLGVVTAGFGIAQVPGWVASAQDAAAQNDIDQVTMAESSAITYRGRYGTSIADLNSLASGVQIQQSAGVKVGVSANSTDWVVVSLSASGTYFARVNGGPIASGPNLSTALARAGGLPTGLSAPVPS